MAQENIKVQYVSGSDIQSSVQTALDAIQAKGGRILGPVSLTNMPMMPAALITYAIAEGS